jgi:hypothetical protein
VKRIQRKRTKGWQMPPNAVYVGRPSPWGNPYHEFGISRERAVKLYRLYVGKWFLEDEPERLDPLRGHDLACWCPLDQPCHADVLLELLR